MLYCPRCNREYNEGVQRFCIHDGGRLMPKDAARKPASGGVFSNLVGKASAHDETDEILSLPNFVPVAKPTEMPQAPSFIREKEPNVFTDPFITEEKPASKQINIDELPSFQAPLGDRKRNPTGRLALSWENPNVLLGHVIRGRYFVEQRVSHDDICITYLAQDKANNNKRVIFKVLALGSEFIQNSADERVALSHLNHPHIVKILDSGEMPEGMPFAVFEYVEGRSLRELLDSADPIAPIEAARIAKQVSEALSGAQQNGVLHYDVRPQKIILKPESDGTEIAKVTDFALAKGYKAPSVRKLKDVAYQSHEQLQGRELTPASESYSLAAIAYEMLTGRLPFNFESMRELLDAQKRGLSSKPSMIMPQIPTAVDEIFTRALAYDPDARYQKSRDFGEAFYNAISTMSAAPQAKEEPIAAPATEDILALDDTAPVTPVITGAPAISRPTNDDVLDLSVNGGVKQEKAEPAPVQATPDIAWKSHIPESEGLSSWAIATICLVGVLLSGVGIFAYVNYFAGGAQHDPVVSDSNTQANVPADGNLPQNPANFVEDSPLPRVIEPPADSTRFQNTKEGLSPVLLKNFRGFSLYYPNSWKKNPSETNFLDILKNSENGVMTEQMLVSWYESKGTFSADESAFPKLAEALKKKWPEGFKAVSQGPQVINNSRQGYEIKFQGEGQTDKNEKVSVWGRTIFLPPGKFGLRSGLVVTMLATSNSADVKGVDDVGTKGELKDILYTLEPDPLDIN